MDYSEAILNVNICTDRIDDIFDKIGRIGLFAGVETEIFEEGDFDVILDGDFFSGLREGVKADSLPWEKRAKGICDFRKCEIRDGLAIWAAEVGN